MSTFPAGHILTSADMDAITPVGVGAFTAFTPTLVQGVTVTKTVSQVQYFKVGRGVLVNYYLTVTGAGTAGSVIQLGLPLASASLAFSGVGSGMLFDTSASTFYSGTAIIDTSTTIKFAANGVGNYLGGASFVAGLAVGDILSAFAFYQSTT